MINKIYRYVITFLLLFFISLIIGCNNSIDRINGDDIDNSYDDLEENDKIVNVDLLNNDSNKENNDEMEQIINVDDFMEFYDISETDVPKEYVQSYIMEYRLPQRIKLDDVNKKWGEKVISAYILGKPMGENLGSVFHGPKSDLKLEEYMENADLILFDFNMFFGNELYTPNKMVIDLKNKKIYFTKTNLENYKEFEMVADLSDDDIQRIKEELPECIKEDNEEGSYGTSTEYSFVINMKASDYSTKFYSGDFGDETHFPGFDVYWKKLYKEYFGKEYYFSE